MCASRIVNGQLGFVQTETLPLFQREVAERLSPTALQLLLARAEVLVEGSTASGASAHGAFLGSAMITIDLAAMGDRLRPPHDGATATKLATALADDAGARRAVIARALEVAGARLAAPAMLRGGELNIRSDGSRVLIDVELEAKGEVVAR